MNQRKRKMIGQIMILVGGIIISLGGWIVYKASDADDTRKEEDAINRSAVTDSLINISSKEIITNQEKQFTEMKDSLKETNTQLKQQPSIQIKGNNNNVTMGDNSPINIDTQPGLDNATKNDLIAWLDNKETAKNQKFHYYNISLHQPSRSGKLASELEIMLQSRGYQNLIVGYSTETGGSPPRVVVADNGNWFKIILNIQ